MSQLLRMELLSGSYLDLVGDTVSDTSLPWNSKHQPQSVVKGKRTKYHECYLGICRRLSVRSRAWIGRPV